MLSKLLLVPMALLLCAQTARSEVSVDIEKALVIEGVISGDNIVHIGQALLDRAAEGQSSADLIINSPGGSVTSGFMFLNMVDEARARGMRIRCFVPEIAASMAFGILVHCDERHALARSFLLWHRARVSVGGLFGSPITAPEALALGRDLASVDRLILDETTKALGIDPRVVKYHFEQETLHVGTNLHILAPNFITSHTTIQGLYEALRSRGVPRSKSQKPGIFGTFRAGEIIYIHQRFENK